MEDTTRMVEMKRELEESPSIKLGLAIGGGGGEGKRRRTSEFTVAQVSQLEQQRLIFKYISAGLAPPFHLVLPIYKSVAASLSYVNFYQQYPSFLGHGAFDYTSKMDAEPGRCRRTDGKKWRCSRAIVPDEKYCEKHIHRGRQRSRKPVETSEVTSPLSTKLPKNADDKLSNSRKHLQNHTPKGLLVMAQPSNNGSASHNQMTFSSGYHELPKNVSTVAYTSTTGTPYRTAITPAAAASCTTAGQMITTTSACNDNNIWIGVKDYDSNHHASIIRGTRNNINVGSGCSPKSVLQAGHMILVNCNGLHFDNRSGEELEPGRCRRTDGKKWRCKRDVLPDHKYCDRHVHRGVKQMRSCDPVAAASTSATAVNSNPSQTTCIAGEIDSAIPDTNLTMSIPARSPQMQHDEKSNSSCDSDATITDTSLAAYEQLI